MNKVIDEKNTICISDLVLAASLSLHFPIEAIDKSNIYRVQFYFQRNKQILRFVEEYWNKKILIEPQSFALQIKAIKTRIHSPVDL